MVWFEAVDASPIAAYVESIIAPDIDERAIAEDAGRAFRGEKVAALAGWELAGSFSPSERDYAVVCQLVGVAFGEALERRRNRIVDVALTPVLENFASRRDEALAALDELDADALAPKVPAAAVRAPEAEDESDDGAEPEPKTEPESTPEPVPTREGDADDEAASVADGAASDEEEVWQGYPESLGIEFAAPTDARSKILSEAADVDGHVAFVEGLLARYELSDEQRAPIERGLARVRARQRDPLLSMAVVGEFSSGKSSFINALLREEAFEADVIQGTTVASTVIRPYPERTLCLHHTDDLTRGRMVPGVGSAEALAEALRPYTSDERLDEGVRYLSVGHPSDFLARGVSIIDTPGTNSLEAWHEEVTRRTIRERADACIVLTPASQVFSQSLRAFMRQNFSDVLPSCVFVLTKIDLVRANQRERVVEYARQVLRNEFDLEDPLVLPYCSLFDGDEVAEFAESNRGAEEAIARFLGERRVQLQLQRCMALLEDTMDVLGQEVDGLLVAREREHERLVATTTADLEAFVEEQKEAAKEVFESRVAELGEDFKADLVDSTDFAKREVYQALADCSTEGDIRGFIDSGLSEKVEEWTGKMLSDAGVQDGQVCWAYRELRDVVAAHAAKSFECAFEKTYPDLALLGRSIIEPVGFAPQIDSAAFVNTQVLMDLKQMAVDNDNRDTLSFGGHIAGGAAAGAAAGSVIPGLGTVVGGVAGAVVGLARWVSVSDSSERADEFRDQVSGKVRALVDQHFATLSTELQQGYYRYANACWVCLSQFMDSYLERYAQVVERLREQDREAQERVSEEVRRIRADEHVIGERVEVVRATRARIGRL